MRNFLWIAILTLFWSCQTEPTALKTGPWHGTMELQDGKKLPFTLEVYDNQTMTVFNAEERVEGIAITTNGDSIVLEHPVFEGVFKGVYTEDRIQGDFIKPSLDRVVPFELTAGEQARFTQENPAEQDVDGEWEMVFSQGIPEDEYIAKGIFTQKGDVVTGTIRTTTGDYRFLEGVVDGSTMKLSTYDGAHVFLFEATVNDSLMEGVFYSGNHWKEPFVGVRNDNYTLPDANTLTFLKEGYDKFDFSFPDTEGNQVSLSDERFKDKVVIVQIMGTWCPNCLDETKYYTQYYNEHASDSLEFVSLAFEYAKTEESAIRSINKFRNSVGVPYPVLLAQVGSSSKTKANEKLPMLNHVLSYPTTIFLDKKGEVRKIHTGFNGPATGEKYTQFATEFEGFVDSLLKE